MTLHLLIAVLAVACFLAVAAGARMLGRIDLVGLGLALLTIALLFA